MNFTAAARRLLQKSRASLLYWLEGPVVIAKLAEAASCIQAYIWDDRWQQFNTPAGMKDQSDEAKINLGYLKDIFINQSNFLTLTIAT